MRNGSDLRQRLFGQRAQPHQCLAPRGWQGRGKIIQHLQIQLDTCQRLSSSGMQFARDTRSLPVQFLDNGTCCAALARVCIGNTACYKIVKPAVLFPDARQHFGPCLELRAVVAGL